ncbi:MAG: hypothetical protein AB1899_05290, partial [Pseudomonadota bacterium]
HQVDGRCCALGRPGSLGRSGLATWCSVATTPGPRSRAVLTGAKVHPQSQGRATELHTSA